MNDLLKILALVVWQSWPRLYSLCLSVPCTFYDMVVTLETGIVVSFSRQISSTYSVTHGAALKDKLLAPQMRGERLKLQMIGREQ